MKLNSDLIPMDYIKSNIVESGSNSNGSWTKWPDGTMICNQKKTFTNVTGFWGLGALPDFPVSFATAPYSYITYKEPDANTANIIFRDAPNITNANPSSSHFIVWQDGRSATTSVTVYILSIGKWK